MKFKDNWTEVPYVPSTEEEEEAWKDLEKKMKSAADAGAQAIANQIDSLALVGKTSKD